MKSHSQNLNHLFIRAAVFAALSVAGATTFAADRNSALPVTNAIASVTASSLRTNSSIEQGGFASANDAAAAFAKAYAAKSKSESTEFNAGIVRESNGTFGFAVPLSGPTSATTVNVSDYHRQLRDSFGTDYVALAHTSLDDDTRFSPIDANDASIMPIYQVLSSGQTWVLDKDIVRNRLRSETIQGAAPLRVYLQRHEGMSGECVNACG